MAQLQRLAVRVWLDVGRTTPPPRVVAGSGMPWGTLYVGWTSYEQGGRIVLARHQRNMAVLLHEVAHALHPRGIAHGPRFMKTWIGLCVQYGRADPAYLINMAAEAKVL